MTVSPCISICRTDPVTGYCYGCGRNSDDKIKWKDTNTTDEWKEENLKTIYQEKIDKKKEFLDNEKKSEISKEILKNFPDANLIDVRKEDE